jgi:beta-mannosidase
MPLKDAAMALKFIYLITCKLKPFIQLPMKNTLLICTMWLIQTLASGQSLNQSIIPLKWELGYIPDGTGKTMKWIPATVPGAVQLDVARAEQYATWYYAENWKNYLWMEDLYFTYRSSFRKPELKPGERLFFFSAGIDYAFDILLNGEKIFQQEGMFTPVKIELTGRLKTENEINVVIHPIPKSNPSPVDRSQADHSVKPAVSYGWDWHPRLVPSGIWDETGLVTEQTGMITECETKYSLNESFGKADISFRATGRDLKDLKYVWSLIGMNGAEVLKKEGTCSSQSAECTATLEKPELWWPHDQGRPFLYTSRVQLINLQGKVIQTLESSLGFRRIRLVMSTPTLEDPKDFPKSRRLPPIQLEINGRRIFCKGSNWVNPEVFPGIITASRYEELIDRAIEANFNIFRVWGGGIVNKESFFELCDKKGILVWQEFPLACNAYPDDPRYLKILEQESTSIINRLKKHPSLAFWCGGNELFNGWSGMNDQSLALRLLNAQCLKLDPLTPFIPTSPLEGMGHGHYVFRDFVSGEEVFARMNRAHCTAYTEFGMPAPAAVELLQSIIPPAELWPPAPGGSWESHHAYKAWVGNTWLMQDMIEDYFGKSASLEELVAHGQLIQGEGYKYIFEEARRQKPFCSMALNWCYNEPWPTAANNSLVSWPNITKPGFYQVRNACRPVLASATLQKFVWKPGELFSTRLWILNDDPGSTPGGTVKASLKNGTTQLPLGTWTYNTLESNINQKGPELSVKMPGWPAGQISLMLEVDGHPELNSEYILLIGK